MLERKSLDLRGSERTSTVAGGARLAAKRKRAKRRVALFFSLFLLLCVGAFIWLTWQPYLRMNEVVVQDSLRPLVESELAGSYLGVVPRNSFFFVPKSSIRAAILKSRPDVQAVSISRETVTKLAVSLHERVGVAKWCGVMRLSEIGPCYLFDASGYIYMEQASTSATLNPFAVYSALEDGGSPPRGNTLKDAESLPAVFEFARTVASFGSAAAVVAIREDEVDVELESGTMLTYVRGDEQGAYANLISAKNNLNLADGSLTYVDLRFPGKVYLKRADGSESE